MSIKSHSKMRPTIKRLFAGSALPGATPWTIPAWSEFGVNPVERDYSVFAIWPPYGTLRAQLIDNTGTLVKSGNGVTVPASVFDRLKKG